MDLFVMNRYQPAGQNIGPSEKEAKILARLNARKSQRAAEQASIAQDVTPDPVPEPVPTEEQPSLKRKHEVSSEPTQIPPVTVDEVPKASKKKKKKVTIEENGIKTTDNQTEKDETEPDMEHMPSAFSEPKKRKPRKPKEDVIIPTPEHIEEEAVPAVEVEEEAPGTGFTILDEVQADKHQRTHRVLPNWLAKPSVISCDLKGEKMPIGKEVAGLDKFLVEALRRNKVKNLFPVQQQIIPWLLSSQKQLYRPCDICVSAPTGSGKTLAFVLPTVQALVKQTVRRLRCLVVLPVHDLAVQVYRVYTSYCVGTKLHVALISGQTSFYDEQQLLTRKGVNGEYLCKADIVVCTPGRLVDHLQKTPGFSLKSLRYLIIDEADRIMDESHNDWLYHVEKSISTHSEPLVAQKLSKPWENYVQKLLFSATLSQDPEKLTRLGLFQPKLFTSIVEEGDDGASHHFVGKYTTPAELVEHYVQCSPSLKPLMVYYLLKKFQYTRALCFSVSKDSTHRLCLLLKHFGDDFKVAECSSEISKQARDQLLKDFSSGKINLLVCTDAVARGMDLGVVDCVISYDPPKFVKNYIHRVGRTARAGRTGTAITLLSDSEMAGFKRLIDMAEKKSVTELTVESGEVEVYEDKFRGALDALKASVVEEKQVQMKKSDRVRRKKKFIPKKKNNKNKGKK